MLVIAIWKNKKKEEWPSSSLIGSALSGSLTREKHGAPTAVLMGLQKGQLYDEVLTWTPRTETLLTSLQAKAGMDNNK